MNALCISDLLEKTTQLLAAFVKAHDDKFAPCGLYRYRYILIRDGVVERNRRANHRKTKTTSLRFGLLKVKTTAFKEVGNHCSQTTNRPLRGWPFVH